MFIQEKQIKGKTSLHSFLATGLRFLNVQFDVVSNPKVDSRFLLGQGCELQLRVSAAGPKAAQSCPPF